MNKLKNNELTMSSDPLLVGTYFGRSLIVAERLDTSKLKLDFSNELSTESVIFDSRSAGV